MTPWTKFTPSTADLLVFMDMDNRPDRSKVNSPRNSLASVSFHLGIEGGSVARSWVTLTLCQVPKNVCFFE